MNRAELRAFLLGQAVQPVPFLPLATELCARLAHVPTAALFEDPGVASRALLQGWSLGGYDAVLVGPRAAAVADLAESAVAAVRQEGAGVGPEGSRRELDTVRETVVRLRPQLGEQGSLVLTLPGPATLAAEPAGPGAALDAEEWVAQLLGVLAGSHPAQLDALAVLEIAPLGGNDVGVAQPELAAALTPVWNVARHYALPSLLLAARAGPWVARLGADACAVWSGADPAELFAAGARRVGVAVRPDPAPGEDRVPALPGTFYGTAGELPADLGVPAVRDLVTRVRALGADAARAAG